MAREALRRFPGIEVAVLEKEAALAAHQTGHSSGVIHAGVYYAPGSLKAKLCVEGTRAMYAYCDEHGIPYDRYGKVVVATDEGEVERLEELFFRSKKTASPTSRCGRPGRARRGRAVGPKVFARSTRRQRA